MTEHAAEAGGQWAMWTADQHIGEAQALMRQHRADLDAGKYRGMVGGLEPYKVTLAKMHVEMAQAKVVQQQTSFLQRTIQYVDTRSLR